MIDGLSTPDEFRGSSESISTRQALGLGKGEVCHFLLYSAGGGSMDQCCTRKAQSTTGSWRKSFAFEDALPSFRLHLPTPDPQGWKTVKKRLEAGSRLQGKLLYSASS